MSNVDKVYACTVQEVFSGDDLIAMVDLGVDNLHKRVRIRLHEVDTPPAVGAGDNSVPGEIRTFVRQLVRNRKAKITVVSEGPRSWVVVLVVESPLGPQNVNEILVARGYQFKR